MGNSYKNIDHQVTSLTAGVIRWRWLVVLASIIIAFAIGSGGRLIEFANNYRVFFSDENPELRTFENLQATYTKNDNFIFVLEPADGNVFSVQTLSAVEKLTEAAWKTPHAIRVDSITNFQHSYGSDDDLIVEDLFQDVDQLSESERQRRGQVALDEPLLRNQIVTPDGSATAVNIVLQYPEQSLTEVPEAVDFARGLRDWILTEHPEIDVSLSGVSMLNNAFAETGMKDLGTLIPAMFTVILLLTLVILRSVSATFVTLAVVLFSSLVGMGWAGFADIKLTPISGSAPVIILTLAIADSIHVLSSLRTAMQGGMSKDAAIIEAMRLNFIPVSVTSLTTIIGFLALNFSDSPPFWHLGNITAIGIAAAWAFSITLLPALMQLLPYHPKQTSGSSSGERLMLRLANFVIARPLRLLLFSAGAVVMLMSFIPAIDFNDQWTKYFDERIEFRRDTDKALENFGMYPIEFSVPARDAGGVSEPEYLIHLERFADYLRTQPVVTHVYSLSDIMKRLNKNLHADNNHYYSIPDNRQSAAQYLLLYELSLPYGLDLNDRINIDKSATRVTATLGNVDSIKTKQFLAKTDAWMKANLPDYMYANPTSAQVMFTYIAQRNVENMVTGTVIAIALIALILMVALRSFKLGLMSLLPNAMPILATFGTWSLLVGQVGFSVATVASISLGIIVDDTVHLLSKYVRARTERGGTAADAIRYAYKNVGIVLIVNTVILTSGFLVLLSSSFKINVDMGMLTVLAIVFALILDFLFLPALLLLIDRADKPKQTKGVMNMSLTQVKSQPVGIVSGLIVFGVLTLALYTSSSYANTQLTPVRGKTDEQRLGFEIAALSDRSDRGFGDSEVALEMVLRNAAGRESRRTLKIMTLEIDDESVGDKSLVVFDSPNDIKGTALLSHAQILDPDNQWLFLPSLKRVKRISSANKSGPFVGSEFAFEDFTALELNKYSYNWLRHEIFDGLETDVIERTPLYEKSGYSRQITWIDRDIHQVRKVEFYDRRGDLLKTLVLTDYHDYDGIWRSHHFEMVNHQTGKSTDLIYSDYTFGIGMKQNDFIKGRLTRLR